MRINLHVVMTISSAMFIGTVADILNNFGRFVVPRPNLKVIGLDGQSFPSRPMTWSDGKRGWFE